MSVSNEEYVEEILWESHTYGVVSEVRNRAEKLMESKKLRRSTAYAQAYEEIIKPLKEKKNDTEGTQGE